MYYGASRGQTVHSKSSLQNSKHCLRPVTGRKLIDLETSIIFNSTFTV